MIEFLSLIIVDNANDYVNTNFLMVLHLDPTNFYNYEPYYFTSLQAVYPYEYSYSEWFVNEHSVCVPTWTGCSATDIAEFRVLFPKVYPTLQRIISEIYVR